MPNWPLAYHITFGTYGTRLHGDERGTVIREQNRFGDPICEFDPLLESIERSALRFDPIRLTLQQRLHIEQVIPEICVRGGWRLHTCAGQPDHVHVVLSAQVEGKRIRNWLKRWLGESLSKEWPLHPDQTWWADGGSVKWIYDVAYFETAIRHVERQRTTREPE